MVGIASLGGSAAYIGKVRDDRLGQVFREQMQGAGVVFDAPPAADGPPTGRCVVLVTPDAQRTMQTFLGSSALLSPEDIDQGTIVASAITLLEGYLWDPPPAKQAFLRAAGIAHAAGRKVALSLSDRFCVDRHRKEFQDLVEKHVDILFANEDEAIALHESADLDGALQRIGAACEVAAITRGERGSIILSAGGVTEVAAEPVERVVDTTGAGDLFAAGFLFGLSRAADPATCGRLGSLAAAEIVSHFGARPERSFAELVRDKLGAWDTGCR
jgi:sugar/nucleoside kinase (ribokinase family)